MKDSVVTARVVAGFVALALVAPLPASSAEIAPAVANLVSPGNFGGVGLIETRSARMGPDGLATIGLSQAFPYKRTLLTLHVMPWLEATFRYTEVQNRLYSSDPRFSGTQTYKDRSADLKFHLWSESDYLPEVAIGFQDLLGTGVFEGEYVVASKRYRDLDFSLGLGWDYLGSRGNLPNPLRNFSRTFKPEQGQGGQVNLSRLFSGDTIGPFGGIEYHTPIEGLSLKIEYDGHDPAKEALDNALPYKSPINYGFNFRPWSWIDISVGRERGDTLSTRVTLRANLQDQASLPKFDPPPPSIEPRQTIAMLAGPNADAVPTTPLRPSPPPSASKVAAAPFSETRPTPTPSVANLAGRRPPSPDLGVELYGIFGSFGLSVLDVAVVGDEYVVTVDGTSDTDYESAARAAFGGVPEDVDSVIVVDPGVIATRVQRFPGIRSMPPMPDLFDSLAALGLDISDVRIIGAAATVSVTPILAGARFDLAAAARVAAASLEVSVAIVRAARPAKTIAAAPPLNSVTLLAPLTAPAITPLGPLAATPPLQIYPLTLDRLDFAQLAAAAGIDHDTVPADPAYTREQIAAVRSRVGQELSKYGFSLDSLRLGSRSVVAEVTMNQFPQEARNFGTAARVIASYIPAPIEEITVASLSGGMQLARVTFRRTDLERQAAGEGTPEEVMAHAVWEPGQPGMPGLAADSNTGRYPRFTWSAAPQTRQHIGGPNQFLLYQFWLAFNAGVEIRRGWSAETSFGLDLYNNFKKITLVSDSVLPHVRSDIRNYLQEGANNITRLQTDFFFKAGPELYTRMSLGLFEEMFGGVSAETLFRPFNSRLSLGLELDRVRQRDYQQLFAFREYAVTTGHFSLYYELPYKNLLLMAHVGRYLAGDVGATYELSRRFDSGVRVGLWTTFTNVSAQRFGEGSFDKGFFIVVPFDLLLTHSTPSASVFAFRPLSRDGGQRLIMTTRLYDVTSAGNLDAVTRDWPQLFR